MSEASSPKVTVCGVVKVVALEIDPPALKVMEPEAMVSVKEEILTVLLKVVVPA